MRRVLRAALPLALFWLLLSGHYTGLLLALGTLSVVVCCWVLRRMALGETGLTPRMLLRLPWYCVWLAGQILMSAVTVVRQVWRPRPSPQPRVDTTPATDLSVLSQVIYANSITLTPGTLSLTVEDDAIEVHSLRPDELEDLHGGAMLRRVQRLGDR